MNIEDSIEVSVNTEYLAEQSIPEEDRFVFAYHIRIHNSGDNGATLRSRHWFIADGNADNRFVVGKAGLADRLEVGIVDRRNAVLGRPAGKYFGEVDRGGFEIRVRPFGLPVFARRQDR